MSRPSWFLVVCLAPAMAGCEGAPLEGAWKVASVYYDGPDTTYTLTSPQPSLYLFGERYYSVTYVPGDRPRAQWASIIGTDSEKVSAFDSFQAHAGSYDTKAGTVTLEPVVSKIPNTMVPGVSQTSAYVVRGDTLTLTIKQNRTETRTTLTRLE